MPGENETLDSGLDAIASSLISGGEQKPAKPARVSPSTATQDVDEGQDDEDADEISDDVSIDPDVDPDDIDRLEQGDDIDDTPDDEDADDDVQIDPDEVDHEVVIDGKASKVKLKDLKAAYSGEKAISVRLQQAGEFRKQSEVLTNELMKELNTEAAKLKYLDSILAEAEKPGIDLETLRIADPSRYLLEKDKLQEIQAKRRLVAQTADENARKQNALMLHRQNEYAKQEADTLMQKMPELRNPEKAKAIADGWNKAATHYGFNDAELSGIIDHRMLLVLSDAAKYRALVNAKAARTKGGQSNVRSANPKPLLRPGTQNSAQRNNNAKAERAAIARAEKSGSVDDVAATLLVNAPRRLKKTGF